MQMVERQVIKIPQKKLMKSLHRQNKHLHHQHRHYHQQIICQMMIQIYQSHALHHFHLSMHPPIAVNSYFSFSKENISTRISQSLIRSFIFISHFDMHTCAHTKAHFHFESSISILLFSIHHFHQQLTYCQHHAVNWHRQLKKTKNKTANLNASHH